MEAMVIIIVAALAVVSLAVGLAARLLEKGR